MQTIPPALSGLASYPQFILYTLLPRDGKTAKIPIDWRTGATCNAHDSDAWTTFDNAIAQVAAGRGPGVGFVFTDQDPFFFLDIDHALQADGQWSETARTLCGAFAGAAVEVSQSGTGLHIIGSGAHAAPSGHRTKNAQLGIEFYTSARFVALTGLNAVGDVRADASPVIPWLLQHWFPAQTAAVGVAEFTSEPREDWRGPIDDDDLIRRARQSQSAAGVFGSKATFEDLWTGNADVLGRIWPHDTKAWDESNADAALASHLAFWTGCNGERMERLMRRSALVRDKWDREDYLRGYTIPNACAVQRDVCRDKEVVQPPVAADAAPGTADSARMAVREGASHLNPQQQAELFAGCVYVAEIHRVLTRNGSLLKPDQFKAVYGGRTFVMDGANEKSTANAWEAFTESKVIQCPQADSTCFRPDLDPGAIIVHDGRRYANTYTPIETARAQGDLTPFLMHLAKLLPDARDQTIMLSYMAACVQHKGVKFQWAPLLQGAEGNGKSLLSRCVAFAVGERYSHWPRADQISAQFNAWLEGKLFIGVEDIYLPDDRGEVIEVVKPMITNDRLAIEAKGVDQRAAWVCCNFILNSNHKDAWRKTRGDRRIAPLYTAQQDGTDWQRRDGMFGDYFRDLYDWLKRGGGFAIVSEFLHVYPIPDEFNPATTCQRAPDTSSTEEAIAASMGAVEQEILEAIAAGESGFCGGWISSFALNRLLDRVGRSRAYTHRRREKLLNDLGYVRHPDLANGRVDNPVLPDAGKPILFVLAESPAAHLRGRPAIAHAYAVAQGVTLQ